MRRTLSPVLVVLAVLLAPPSLPAQQPASIGTAAGLGLGAMTEARFGEAALWNPALAAIFDGPTTSVGILGVWTEPGPLAQTWDLGHFVWGAMGDTVGVLDGRAAESLAGWRSGDDFSRMRAQAAVQWFSVHARDLLISLATYGYSDLRAPDRVLGIMGGQRELALGPVPAGEVTLAHALESRHSLSSVLAVAKATDLGTLPYLGRAWAGIGVKAALVHDHAIGRFGYVDPLLVSRDQNGVPLDRSLSFAAGEVAGLYTEIGVQRARIYGLDLGLVFNPTPSVLVSIAGTNLVQRAALSADPIDLNGRWLAVAGSDSLGQSRIFAGARPLDLLAGERPWWADGQYLAEGTHYTPLVRAGLSVDTRAGRFVGGVALPLEDAYAMDRDGLDHYSFGWQSAVSPFRPRVSFTRRLDGTSGLEAGFQTGFCADRLAVAVGYLQPPDRGAALSTSLAWSRGGGPCARFR